MRRAAIAGGGKARAKEFAGQHGLKRDTERNVVRGQRREGGRGGEREGSNGRGRGEGERNEIVPAQQPPSAWPGTQFTDRYSPLFVFTAAARESTWVHRRVSSIPRALHARIPPSLCPFPVPLAAFHRSASDPPAARSPRSRAASPLFASVKFSCCPRGGFELTINFGRARHPFRPGPHLSAVVRATHQEYRR